MLVDDFYLHYNNALQYLYSSFVKNKITYQQYLDMLKQHIIQIELSEDASFDDLLYISNQFTKKYYKPEIKNKKYICPGCDYFNEISILDDKQFLTCKNCQSKAKESSDIKIISFRNIFGYHCKTGYKCINCNRFIPENIKNNISCPYLDCTFIGDKSSLKKMRHPSINKEIKNLNLESSLKEDENVILIRRIIEEQKNKLSFADTNFTVPHKLLVYQAFNNYLDKSPKELCDYLMHNSRTGGFQHKIFQEYIKLLENSLPLLIKKNKKHIRVSSLLDKELSIFHNLVTFNGSISNKSISNNTQDIYIGGRKASYNQRYYIGKLLGVINTDTKESLLHLVKEYSFSKITINYHDAPVIVTHLSIPPHYQMGGMVYVNRIRKLLVEEIKSYEKKTST